MNRIYVGLIFCAISCNNPELSVGKLLIKEINNPSTNTDRFEYDGEQLVSFTRTFGTLLSTSTKFEYTDYRVTRAVITNPGVDAGFTIDLKYGPTGHRLEEIRTSKFSGGEYVITSSFSYDDSGFLKSKISTYSDPGQQPTEAEYILENRNIVRINFFVITATGKQLTSYRLISYDNKKNYTNQEVAFLYLTGGESEEFVLSDNNAVSTTDYTAASINERESFDYSYNRSGYPSAFVNKAGGLVYTASQMIYQ